MIKLFLERIALISALSTLVLSAFWPHIKPKLLPFFDKFIFVPVIETFKLGTYAFAQSRSQQEAIIYDHPRFSGRTLKRMTSEKESLRSAYRSLEGFGQSPLSGNPSFSLDLAALGSGHPTRVQFGAAQSQQSSTIPLTIFTSSIIVLIIYIMMKTLTARFCNHQMQSNNRRRTTTTRRGAHQDPGTPYGETNDLRSDKRKLAKLSRKERARELIRRHGGKNVSSAIRFLVAELEKQKQLLYQNLSETVPSCCCSCHNSKQEKSRTDKANGQASEGEIHDHC